MGSLSNKSEFHYTEEWHEDQFFLSEAQLEHVHFKLDYSVIMLNYTGIGQLSEEDMSVSSHCAKFSQGT